MFLELVTMTDTLKLLQLFIKAVKKLTNGLALYTKQRVSNYN